jgi:TonB family protein
MRLLWHLPLLPALLLGGQGAAQSPPISSSPPGQTRLDWGTTELYVTADSAQGVGVWVFGHGAAAPHPVASRFHPDQIEAWLPSARLVVDATDPAGADGARDLAASVLRDAAGGGLLLEWERTGGRGADSVLVVFVSGITQRRFVIRTEPGPARDLLRALDRSLRAARYDARRAEAEAANCPRPGGMGADSLVEAWPVTVPGIVYPASLAGRPEGHVVLEYVVDSSGRIDQASLLVRYATAPPFGEAAIAALRGARFTPATMRGLPVRSCVDAVVRFRPPSGVDHDHD